MALTYTIASGFFDGWTLRSRRRGRAQIESPAVPGKWRPAPLNVIARRYLASDPVWTWLREQGVERPQTSGPSGKHTGDRVAVLVRLDPMLVERAKAHAAATERDLRTLVEDAVRREVG